MFTIDQSCDVPPDPDTGQRLSDSIGRPEGSGGQWRALRHRNQDRISEEVEELMVYENLPHSTSDVLRRAELAADPVLFQS